MKALHLIGMCIMALALVAGVLCAAEEADSEKKVVAEEKWLGKGMEYWGSLFMDEKKIGWEHQVLAAEGNERSLMLKSEVNFTTGDQSRTIRIQTRFSRDGNLPLQSYALFVGDEKMAEAKVEDGKLQVKETDGEAVKVEVTPENITSYGLWVWALAMPLAEGKERPCALLEEGKGQLPTKGTLRVVGREKISQTKGAAADKADAWKLEVKRGAEEGMKFWLDDNHRILQASYGRIVSRAEADEKAAKAGLEK